MEIITFRDTVKYYKKNAQSLQRHSIGDYCKVMSLFMEKLVERLKLEGEVNLPNALGKVVIIGKKVKPRIDKDGEIKGLAPDWKASKDLWAKHPETKGQIVYHTNDNTSGVRYRINWSVANCLVRNKNLYTLAAARHLKREVSHLITNGKEYQIKA